MPTGSIKSVTMKLLYLYKRAKTTHIEMSNFREMSDFRSGIILGKHFPEALVHTVHRTSACGTRPMDSMDLCFRKTLSQNSPRAEVAFSNSCHLLNMKIKNL